MVTRAVPSGPVAQWVPHSAGTGSGGAGRPRARGMRHSTTTGVAGLQVLDAEPPGADAAAASGGVGLVLEAGATGVRVGEVVGHAQVEACQGLGSSAWLPQRVQAGDAILAVDDGWVVGQDVSSIEALLRAGPPGSEVRLRLVRADAEGQLERQYRAVLRRLPRAHLEDLASPSAALATVPPPAGRTRVIVAVQPVPHAGALPAVKQWCPECDPGGPKSTRRSVEVAPTIWCPEAEPRPSSRLPGTHWIPEAAAVPERTESKLPTAVNLRRGLTPRAAGAPGGSHGVPTSANDMQIVHASEPFFSHEATPHDHARQHARHDARHAMPTAQAQEAVANSTPKVPEGPASAQTASTVSKSPTSHDDVGSVDSTERQQPTELSSLPLTPHKCAGGDEARQDLAAGQVGEGQVASASKVLHSGRGGIGRRREVAGCNGRYGKCQVVRSHQCCLRVLGTSVQFVFAQGSQQQECFALSRQTQLRLKGGRVELVQPDGRHMWLWNVAPHALLLVQQTFAELLQSSSEAQTRVPVDVPAEAVPAAEGKSAGNRCEVQLGFVPLNAGAEVVSGGAASPAAPPRTASVLPDTQRARTHKARTQVPALRLEELKAPEPYRPIPRVPSEASTSASSSSDSALPSDTSSRQSMLLTSQVQFPLLVVLERVYWRVRSWPWCVLVVTPMLCPAVREPGLGYVTQILSNTGTSTLHSGQVGGLPERFARGKSTHPCAATPCSRGQRRARGERGKTAGVRQQEPHQY